MESAVALIHGYQWACGDLRIPLGSGVSVGPYVGSLVEPLYEGLCENDGVDEGDPLGFEVCVYFEPTLTTKRYPDYGYWHFRIDRTINLICMATGVSPGTVRVIYSDDSFKTSRSTSVAAEYSDLTEFIGVLGRRAVIDGATIDCVDRIAKTENSIAHRRQFGALTALDNALEFFYHAWRSPTPEHCCINLAIVMESLFGPPQGGETTHQLAFSMSRYRFSDPGERERFFELVKKFYGIRSAIVHGRQPSTDMSIVETMFREIAAIFRLVLDSDESAAVFETETLRRAALRRLLFV